MKLLDDPNLWLTVLVCAGLVVGVAAVVIGLRYVAFKCLHWLAAGIRTVAPPAVADWVIGLVRFFYIAALFCGLTAFVLSFLIWRAPWPPSGLSDPVLRNPLFWLTWLAVMTAIMLAGIIAGLVLRTVLTVVTARSGKGLDGVKRSTK
jgi:hypothetical protein